MPPNPKKFIKSLSPEDRLRIYFASSKGKIYKFSIQYESLIENNWHIIMRIDNFHQSTPHKHIYYLNRQPYKQELGADPHLVFRTFDRLLRLKYKIIKDNFLRNS